ncbi:MAG TPA: glycosyltransferase, partial [Bacteroidia bacterium]|nr:glycosyltransferase [Bacteroidia bacterium]
IKAADIIALLSESEASNNTIKEAGYFEKPVAICKGVGDFDDYIEHKISGIFLSKEKPVNEFVSYIQGLYKNPSPYTEMGKSLKQKVVENFDIHFVGLEYEKLQKKLLNK